jgi:serralysin
MATPTTCGQVSFASVSGTNEIDSLLAGTKWGGRTGFAVEVTYSFPGYGASWSTDWSNGYGPSSGGGEPWSRAYAPLTASQQSAAQSALQKWASVAAITFALSPDNSSTVGDIRFAWTGSTSEQAHAYLPDPGAPNSGDIWLNANASGWGGFALGTYGYATLLHEIGHAIGLKHPFEQMQGNPATLSEQDDVLRNTIMSYSAYVGAPSGVSWSFEPTTPMPLDIQAAQYLYGPNNSYHSGDDTYVYNAGRSYFETIWDSGGNDTIQYIAASDHAEIDLRPGAFSDLGNMLTSTDHARATPYDVAIYDGVVIENAIGGNGPDLIYGNDAANRLDGAGGNDTVDGGQGNDTLYAGGGGLDRLNGGAGIDTVDFSHSASGIFVWLGYTLDPNEAWSNGAPIGDLTSIENIVDSPNPDFMRGDAGANTFSYSGGLDYIDGQGGSDTADFSRLTFGVSVTLSGAEARNATSQAKLADIVNVENLIGTQSADQLTGDASANVLTGGDGNDTLYSSGGLDTLNGGVGTDAVDFSHSASGIFVWLGYTSDPNEAWSQGAPIGDLSSIENIADSPQSDFLRGDAGANRFTYSGGLDYIDGQGGSDTVDFSRLDFGIHATLAASEARNGTSNVKLADLVNVENLVGSQSLDQLTGDASANVLAGGDGNDTLYASGGLDTLNGGAGIDTVDFSHSASGIFVWLGYTGDPNEAWSQGVPIGDLASIENIVDSPQSDFLRGDAGANKFTYSGGLDYIDGQGGSDTADFSRLDFGIHATLAGAEARNGTSNVKLADLLNLENLVGSQSLDQLTGDASVNILAGGAGNDTLAGGSGADRFDYNPNDGVDTITDFARGAGGDVVDIADVLVGYSAGVSNAASFVHLLEAGGNTTIQVNSDGAGNDFAAIIVLQGAVGLVLNDLLSQGNLYLG